MFYYVCSKLFGYLADVLRPKYVPYCEVFHLADCGVCRAISSSARRAENSPPDCFLYARSNPFGYLADVLRPKYVPYCEVFHLADCGVCKAISSSARRAKNSPPDCFLYARSNPFGYLADNFIGIPQKRYPYKMAFHSTFDTFFIAVDERQLKNPSFSF